MRVLNPIFGKTQAPIRRVFFFAFFCISQVEHLDTQVTAAGAVATRRININNNRRLVHYSASCAKGKEEEETDNKKNHNNNKVEGSSSRRNSRNLDARPNDRQLQAKDPYFFSPCFS